MLKKKRKQIQTASARYKCAPSHQILGPAVVHVDGFT